MAALLLWTLDASLNISMEPFRAFVGDMLRKDQHTAGYAVQTAFIGAGAVVGSIFPWLLDQMGVANAAADGGIPDTVRYAFWFGGAALFFAVLWTVFTTKEYSPEEMARFDAGADHPSSDQTLRALAARSFGSSLAWLAAGVLVLLAVLNWGLEKEVYILGGLLIGYGVASIAAILLARAGSSSNMLANIVGDFAGMPTIMKRLAVAQFFSWSALFIMWINTTPVVAGSILRFARSGQRRLPGGGQLGRRPVRHLQRRRGGRGAGAAAVACSSDRQGADAHHRIARRRGRFRQLLPDHRSAIC